MKALLIFLSIIFLVNCASQEDRWVIPKFNTSQIQKVNLNKELQSEEYNIFSCSKSKADGTILLENNSVLYFCIAKHNEKKFAKITTSESNVEICIWKESGFCDDEGLCQSIFSASDCKKL